MAAKPNELSFTRVYKAPVKLVWEAWTDPKRAAKWWGPRGFTITTKSKDLRPGGKWIYTMHGPDGVDYPNISTYHVVEKYQRLHYDHGGDETRQKLFTVDVTFKEKKGFTTMHMTMAWDTELEAKEARKFIKLANGHSTWDRLGEYLESEQAGTEVFIIHREIEADIERVFQAWQDPQKSEQWLGPNGTNMKILKSEARQDGKLFVYSQSHPDELLTTVELTPEEDGHTRMSIRREVQGNATAQEKKTFAESRSNMMMSWNESFDKLDQLVSK